jgi:serine/threonine-protein kinase
MRVTLTVTAGPHKGRVFMFAGHDTFIVGRSKRCHFQLPAKDRYFSRVHFMVEVNPPQCRLMDLASRNGTRVNDERIDSADLKHGDKIRAGRTILRVAVQTEEIDPIPWSEPVSTPPVQQPLPPADQIEAPAPAPQPASAAADNAATEEAGFEWVSTVAAPPPSPSQLVPPRPCPACGTAFIPPAQPAPDAIALCTDCENLARNQPLRVPGYRIVRELGKGGMGIVYLAVRSADAAPVAVKTITPAAAGSRAQLERFLREAAILRELDHPHIVAFRDLGEIDGQLFFVMDYVKGVNASTLLRTHGPLPIARAVGLTCQLFEALEYAHDKGFVHRDIKPSNVLVTDVDGREFVKLADFGLARVYQASQLSGLTIHGEIGGTVAFMAPEQITNFREAKPPADQYAAAATLYKLLTGKAIYDLPSEFNKQIAMILNDDPLPIEARRPDLPKKLGQAIHMALARQPEKRFRDVRALRKTLAGFLA